MEPNADIRTRASRPVLVEVVDLVATRPTLDPLHHELGDAIAAPHRELVGRIGVHQEHLQLAAVARVDESRRVEHRDAVRNARPDRGCTKPA